MISSKYVVLGLCFFSLSVFSQSYFFDDLPLLFKHGENEEVIIIENEETIIKVNENIKIPLYHNGYPGQLNDYIFFNIKNKTYFVHRGCGPVLEFRNDSLVRIDNSFLHLNQFDAATFVHNDEIYFFGGYGLFTHKNILTKYDFDLKKWSLVKTKNPEIVSPLQRIFYYNDKKYLYVFGGLNNDLLNVNIFHNKQDVYRLDLKELVWEKFKTNFFDDFKTDENPNNSNNPHIIKSSIKISDSLFLISDEKAYSIDLIKNRVTNFSRKFKIQFHRPFIIDNELHAIIINGAHSTNKYEYKKYPIATLFKNPIPKGSFYYEENSYAGYGLSIFLVIVFIGLGLKKRSYLTYLINAKYPFHYQKSNARLYFKGVLLKRVSDDDLMLLNKIASKPNQFISLNEFNDLFTHDFEKENYATILKRREKKLDNFIKMLTNVSGYDSSELILVRKNGNDQRIKEILILPSKIKYFD
jgi:hypothetical protein